MATKEQFSENKHDLDIDLTLKRLKLYESIINKSQNGILVFNDKFEVIFSNTRSGEILHETASTLRGRSLSDFIPLTIRQQHKGYVDHFSITLEKRQELLDWRHIQCCRLDGSQFPASVVIEKVPVASSTAFIVFLEDMTEVLEIENNRFEAELNYFQSYRQKEYANNSLQFHIEQNIAQIAKIVQSIKEVYDLKPITDAMSNIMQYGMSTLGLAQKALYVSEIGKEGKKFNLVDQSLQGIFERLQLVMENQEKNSPQKIEWNIPVEAKEIFLKEDQHIEQILYNVLEDLRKNAPTEIIKFAIPILEQIEKGVIKIQFLIRLSGFGVSQDMMNMLLEAPKNQKLREGNKLHLEGLGFRLANNLTKRLNGKMIVKTHEDEWTNIKINLETPVINENSELGVKATNDQNFVQNTEMI
jgi:PAS domain S-box-containing protein